MTEALALDHYMAEAGSKHFGFFLILGVSGKSKVVSRHNESFYVHALQGGSESVKIMFPPGAISMPPMPPSV